MTSPSLRISTQIYRNLIVELLISEEHASVGGIDVQLRRQSGRDPLQPSLSDAPIRSSSCRGDSAELLLCHAREQSMIEARWEVYQNKHGFSYSSYPQRTAATLD